MRIIFKNKLFIGAICLLLAAVIAFVLLPRLYKAQSSTAQVVTLKATVEQGTEITENMLSVTEVGAYGLPNGVVTDKASIVGLAAGSTLYAGEYLWRDRFVSVSDYQNNGTDRKLEIGSYLLTIKFPSTSAGLAGVLRGNSVVDVYSFSENGDGTTTTERAIEGLEVFMVLNIKLQSLDELDALTRIAETGSSDYDFAPAYIVVKASEQQVKTLIRLEKSESLHLALVKAGK